MKWYTYLLIAGLLYGIHSNCSVNLSHDGTSDRKSYVKNVYTDIHGLTKRLDSLMHRKAFTHNPLNRENMYEKIKAVRYKRDILIQHLRDLKQHGFEQIHQI